MDDVTVAKLEELAESAERRAKELHRTYLEEEMSKADAASLLNDFFYWSGKATAYRGVVAMVGLQGVVDEELDETPTCP